MTSPIPYPVNPDNRLLPDRREARLAAAPADPWRAAARLALAVLVSAALVAAPVVLWAVWLRGR